MIFGGSYASHRSAGIREAFAMVLTWLVCGAGIMLYAGLVMFAAMWLAEFVGVRSIFPFTLAGVVSVTMLAVAGIIRLRR